MYKIKMYVLGLEMEFQADDQKALWRQVSLFQALPETCPIDESRTRLNYRYVDENDFFEVVNATGTIKFSLGQYKKGGDLFAKNTWSIYNPDQRAEVVLWENGRLTEAGAKLRRQLLGESKPPVETEHRKARQPAQPVAEEPPPIPIDDNPFVDPTAGANADKRQPLLAEIVRLAGTVYGKRAQEELDNITAGITDGLIAQPAELDFVQLERVKAVILLDQTGTKKHGQGWQTALKKAVAHRGFESVYDMSTAQIDKLHQALQAAGKPVAA